MGINHARARLIADQLLQQTGQDLMSGAFDSFSAAFDFPHRIETYHGDRIIADAADLRYVFDALRTYLSKSSVTDYVRQIIAAEFQTPDEITSVHESRMMNRNFITRGPYVTYTKILYVDGSWKISDSKYAVDGDPEINNLLLASRPTST